MTRPIASTLSLAAVLVCVAGTAAAVPVTVVVNSTADAVTPCATTGQSASGSGCTLRDAITYSDANPPTSPARNQILFNIPGSGVHTIDVASPLPQITAAAVMDGYTQPGASQNTQAVGSDAVIQVFVRGGRNLTRLLVVSGGTGSVIRGLALGNLDNGIEPDLPQVALTLDSCCNTVTGNFIGVDPGLGGGDVFYGGVVVNSSLNAIGGPAPADRNVCGPTGQSLIQVSGGENRVQGNLVGVDPAGTAGLNSIETGVLVGGPSNEILDNVISANLRGIEVDSDDNVISGNRIGTDAAGTAPLPNTLDGVVLYGSGNVVGAANSTNPILGSLFEGNEIAYSSNGASGITVFGVKNSLLSNSIFSNDGLGIDLGADFVTSNDFKDGDSGADALQNYPVLSGAWGAGSNTQVAGSLNSTPHTTFRIQLFSDTSCDPSGFGEGETLVDETFVTSNSAGNASIHETIFPRIPLGQFVTATATDPLGNTSEFSQCVLVTLNGPPPPPPPFPTITRFLEEGPIRVKPGVPVQLPFGVGPKEDARVAASGPVVVSDEAGNTCQANLIRSGVGACALTFTGEGTHRVRAHYAGGGEFLASDSGAIVVKVKAGEGD